MRGLGADHVEDDGRGVRGGGTARCPRGEGGTSTRGEDRAGPLGTTGTGASAGTGAGSGSGTGTGTGTGTIARAADGVHTGLEHLLALVDDLQPVAGRQAGAGARSRQLVRRHEVLGFADLPVRGQQRLDHLARGTCLDPQTGRGERGHEVAQDGRFRLREDMAREVTGPPHLDPEPAGHRLRYIRTPRTCPAVDPGMDGGVEAGVGRRGGVRHPADRTRGPLPPQLPFPGRQSGRGAARGARYAGRVAAANGIWSIGAIRTGAPGCGAWIIWPSPT
ncbi:hypothetical protein DDE74_24350 [Streptomyces lydicus]|uniref:Uncharacterized protein n=1 Tax=Streptomyces lydicus TaxID=47763 RepID=A0A3S9YF75_9ACTN|nr:hypothetical protein DDE74_24350 [Streptomyces lydicus]